MNEVVISVKSDNDTRAGFDSARQDAKALGDDIVTTMDRSGKDGGKKFSDNFGNESKKTGSKFAADFDNVFTKGIIAAGTNVSPKLGEALTKGIETASEAAPQLLVGGIAAALPAAGALLSAGIIGGAGIGGIVGGVILASKDARVSSAFASMKTQIGSELTNAAQPFVKVSLDGISKIGNAIKGIDFKSIFADSAQNAGPIIDGISKAVTSLGDGFESLVSSSGPLMSQLGKSIGEIGDSAGQFLDTVSQGGEGAADSIEDLTNALDGTLNTIGPVIKGLSEIYAKAHDLQLVHVGEDIIGGPLSSIVEIAKAVKSSIDSSNGSIGKWVDSTNSLNDAQIVSARTIESRSIPALEQYAKEAQAATSANDSFYGSQTNLAQAEADATKAIKENGKTLDLHTAAGRANRTALLGVANAVNDTYDKEVALNGVTPKTIADGQRMRDGFISLAEKAHLSASAAGELADKLLGIKSRNVAVTAATHDAQARIEALQEQLDSLHNKTVRVTVLQSGSVHVSGGSTGSGGTQLKNWTGGIRGAATGGVRSNMTLVGEEGPELLDLPPGARVTSTGDTLRTLTGMGGGDNSTIVINLMAPDGGVLWKAVLPAAQKYSRDRYGNDPVRMLKG